MEGIRNQEQHHNEEEEDDDTISLDEAFFINDDYQLTNFSFGSQEIQLFCLHTASTDFDLTGQVVWPGATLLNDYLSRNSDILQGCTAIELGSGVGVTGILCSRFCEKVVLTDHNEEVLKILKKNIELHSVPENNCPTSHGLVVEKLEWGNSNHISGILQNHPGGFDFILGADIFSKHRSFMNEIWDHLSVHHQYHHYCENLYEDIAFSCSNLHGFLVLEQASIPLLFDTVKMLLSLKEDRECKFILAYVSRAKTIDLMIINEASKHGLLIKELTGTRRVVGNLEGVIYEITLH